MEESQVETVEEISQEDWMRMAVAHERERCARIAEKWSSGCDDSGDSVALGIADEIRGV